ncbi:MAG: PilZ domain-containing protein [Bacillota bacterium]
MAKNDFIKMNIYYPEDQTTVSSTRINFLGERAILLGDDFALIPHQSTVDVVGYLQDGVVLMSGKVTLSTSSQLNFNIIKTDDKQERRNSLKVKVELKTKLLRAFSMGRRSRSFAVNETIITRDLSLGGVAFYSNHVFFKKQKVSIDFNFLKPGFISKAEVLRKEKGPFKNGYRYKYGCRFMNISNEEERVLCEFVFRTQLENHRKLMMLQEQ